MREFSGSADINLHSIAWSVYNPYMEIDSHVKLEDHIQLLRL